MEKQLINPENKKPEIKENQSTKKVETSTFKPKPLPVEKKPTQENKKQEENKNSESSSGKKNSETLTKESKSKITEARVYGRSIPVSTKHAIAVCNFIRRKSIDTALKELAEVEKYKKAIPMKGEIPHRKGIMSGRYPQKTVYHIIRLLRSLRANAIAHDISLEKNNVSCVANTALRPHKRFGRGRTKRTHIEIMLKNTGGKQ